ncbi:MAG: DUF1800 family protein, partial [Planctomycetota bacterium]
IGVKKACEEWIDEQFELPTSYHLPTIENMLQSHGSNNVDPNSHVTRYRYHAFNHNAVAAPDQLKQRVAWALSQILVISDVNNSFGDRALNRDGVPHWLGPTSYYDNLLKATTGNFRDLLTDVTLHPVMGHYLSHLRNTKANPDTGSFPDENFAREIMQLFTIGLYELQRDGRPRLDDDGNLIPTYDNETIKSLARVFTGLTYSRADYFWYGDPRDFVNPMEMWEEHHDTGEKTLLSGTVLPAHDGEPGDGMADIHAALDNLFDHPNVGPFIARRLIQHLVRSNPSRGYIRRVADAFDGRRSGVRGDMVATIKAVLLDPEAWRGTRGRRAREPLRYEVTPRGTAFGRFREPMLQYFALVRAMEATATYDERDSAWFVLPRTQYDLDQSPFGAPSVFNFYLPDYQPPGPLAGEKPPRRLPNDRYFAPEFMMLSPVLNNRIANRFRWEIYNDGGSFTHWGPNNNHHTSRLRFNYGPLYKLLNDDRDALLARLDLVLCQGSMPESTKVAIKDALDAIQLEAPWTDEQDRLKAILTTVIYSPSFVIAK